MKRPSFVRGDIVASLEEKGVPEYKIYHSQAIEALCMHMVDEMQNAGIRVNRNTVTAGALLHDIALAVIPDDETPNHCAVGGRMVRALGYPEEVARCVECHEGIVSREMGADLRVDMTRDHYRPVTWEEKLVFYGDHAVLVFGECAVDLWSDRDSMAKAKYPYLVKVYRRWANKEIGPDHPSVVMTQKLDEEMRPFLTRAAVEDVMPMVRRMQAAFKEAAIPFPFDYSPDVVIPA